MVVVLYSKVVLKMGCSLICGKMEKKLTMLLDVVMVLSTLCRGVMRDMGGCYEELLIVVNNGDVQGCSEGDGCEACYNVGV